MERWTTALEVAGCALVVIGLALWTIPAALVVAGAFCIGGGYLASLPPVKTK